MTKCKHCGIDKEELFKILKDMQDRSEEKIKHLEALREKKIQLLKDICY